jgi:cyclic pyranopterin phosphate synthase
MFLKIQNGKLHTKRLEINVVHHCNLSCRGCSHLSPLMPKYFISPDRLSHDLSILSKYCRPEFTSLLGGEPLLHPDLIKIINVVRRSGISDKIRVVTNGRLLHKMPDQFWKDVDEVHVSLYPSHPMKIKDLAVIKAIAKRNKTPLLLRHQEKFRECISEINSMDEAMTRRIYLTCANSRQDGCHTLFEGHYYKCSQAVFIPLAFGDRFNFSDIQDAVKIQDNKKFVEELTQYLTTEEPLTACRFCLGSVGKQFVPDQISRHGEDQCVSIENLIDWKHLEKLEKKSGMPMPVWMRESVHKMIGLMPPSVLLSPTLRRSIKVLRDISRKHIK